MKKLIAIFISSFIVIFLLLLLFMKKESFSYNENRFLTKMPKFNIDNLFSGRYTNKIDDYISDHFPFRENFLEIKSRFLKLFGVKKQSDVYYGTDGYLLQEYNKPKKSDTILNVINKFVDNIDVPVDFMLAPTSIFINADKLPKYNQNYDEGITIDYYKENILCNFVDIREVLINNKTNYLFYKTDHHWTTRGAFLAYSKYLNDLGIVSNNYEFELVNTKFYGTLYSKIIDNSLDYDYIEKIKYSGNYNVKYMDNNVQSNSLYNELYLKKKDKYSYFLDNNHTLIEIDNLDIDNGDNLLIIKDSFANSFIPMIVNHYDKVSIIDPRYYKESISEYVLNNNIDRVLFLYNVLTIDDDLGIIQIR